MCASVNNRIALEAVRQVLVSAAVPKTELQDPHAGKIQLLAEFGHFGRDVAKIFGYERQLSERAAQCVEEVHIGPLHPMPVDGRRFVGWDLPVGLESAEMVEPYDVVGLNRPAHALDPPVVPAQLELVPVVERIAPALAGFAEGIRRDAGDNLG